MLQTDRVTATDLIPCTESKVSPSGSDDKDDVAMPELGACHEDNTDSADHKGDNIGMRYSTRSMTKSMKCKKSEVNGKAALSEEQNCDPSDQKKPDPEHFKKQLLDKSNTSLINDYKRIPFDPKFVDKDGSTYVTYACMGGHIDIACALLKKHPEAATLHSTTGGTPMQTMAYYSKGHSSSLEDYTAFITALQAETANIDESKSFASFQGLPEETPLQYAIDYRNKNCVQALINCGADLTVQYGYSFDLLTHMTDILEFHGSSIEMPTIIAILRMLIPHFKVFGYLTQDILESTIRDQIKEFKHSDKFLAEFDLMKEAKIEAKTQEDAMES